jgi:hypothetical protein
MSAGARRWQNLYHLRIAAVAALLALMLLHALPAWAAPARQDRAAAISSPASGTAVSGTVAVSGSALHPEFDRYELYYTVEPGENWVFIGEPGRSPVNNGFLINWNTGSLPDGSYSLRLRVVRRDGNYDEAFARNVVVANSAPPTPVPTDTPVEPEVQPTLPPPVEAVVTPTPEATATPVTVEQPEVPTATPRPSPTATPEEEAVAVVDEGDQGGALTDAVDTSSLRSSFVRGATIAASIFVAAGAFFAIRRLFTWIWYLIAP